MEISRPLHTDTAAGAFLLWHYEEKISPSVAFVWKSDDGESTESGDLLNVESALLNKYSMRLI